MAMWTLKNVCDKIDSNFFAVFFLNKTFFKCWYIIIWMNHYYYYLFIYLFFQLNSFSKPKVHCTEVIKNSKKKKKKKKI